MASHCRHCREPLIFCECMCDCGDDWKELCECSARERNEELRTKEEFRKTEEFRARVKRFAEAEGLDVNALLGRL